MFCCVGEAKEVPGGVYLCQVSESVSCGACCGLYNVQDARLDSLEPLLLYRTETFRHVPRKMEAILAFKEDIESKEAQERPFSEFHHCPYIGLIGKQRLRVGCLLHPSADGNDHIDWRGLSYYGGLACRTYFCPSCHQLSSNWKEIIVQTAPHWHLYGLVVTETKMLEAFFQTIENLIRRPLSAEDICHHDKAVEALWEFFALKLEWPFRNKTFPVWGNYFFYDGVHGHPAIAYENIGASPSRFDPIFRAMRSSFATRKDLESAEDLLQGIIEKLARCISSRYAGVVPFFLTDRSDHGTY